MKMGDQLRKLESV